MDANWIILRGVTRRHLFSRRRTSLYTIAGYISRRLVATVIFMIDNADFVAPETLLSSARQLLHDFAAISGRKGIVTAAYVVLGAMLESVSISLIVPLLGVIFGTGAAPGWLGRAGSALFELFGTATPFSRLLLLLGIFGTLMILRAAVISVRDIASVELQIGFIETQRLRIAERLAAARWDYISQLRHSRIAHLMSGDIQRLGLGVQLLLQVGAAIVMLVAQCIVAFFLSPALAAVIVALLAVGTIAFSPMMRRARNLGSYMTEANLSLLDSTTQFLGGLKLAISQNLEKSFVAEARQTLNQIARRQINYSKQHVYAKAALTSLSALVSAGLVLAGFGWLHVAPSVLIALLLIVTRMIGPVGEIQRGAQQFANVLATYEKVRDLGNELMVVKREKCIETAAPIPHGPIIFENVSFRHSDRGEGCKGVRNLNLTIAPGEFLGITGASGAGKTSFADLLVGLYPPQTGRIVVGATTLKGSTLTAWRNALSYVSQDPFLFHDTIRHNLSWANVQACEDDMWQALSVTGADELIRSMESGLDTVVGERGMLVSGGERQRIALARALLRRPKLMVLDEATGAIDSDGERSLLQRLRALPYPLIIVLIAHRTENLAICDRILRFDAYGGIGAEA